jgi:hypothetical protein
MKRVSGRDHVQWLPQDGVHRPWSTALIVVWALFCNWTLSAQPSKPGEYMIKATYLYNFARYVEWPARFAAAKGDSFAICVLGQDPFGTALDATIAGETIDGQSLLAKRISEPKQGLNCRVLFISSSEEGRLKEILTTLDKTGVLTVSDMPNFSKRGGMIEFVLDGDRIRFAVNLTPAQDAGLTVSSELLKVAISVRRDSHPGD